MKFCYLDYILGPTIYGLNFDICFNRGTKLQWNRLILDRNIGGLNEGGPGFNPQSRTASYQKGYKNGTGSALV